MTTTTISVGEIKTERLGGEPQRKYYIAYWYNFLQTTIHKFWVFVYLLQACWALIKRGIMHDLSKYSKHEAPIFAKNIFKLKTVVYGTPEYKKLLKEVSVATKHHYKCNTHHCEHWPHGLEDLSPLDSVEMICDFKAASRRHKKGSLYYSIVVNAKRFGYNDNVKKAYIRMANEL